ncbi:MAG TPA: GtrA family protein, partial [Candidatus Paceibacterota bacterium]|nr:GtrA family protein [Candidatus Paceibacterota bacterium]
TMQKFWTFQDTPLHDVHAQFGRYLVILVANLTLNTLLMYFFVEQFGLWYLYAQILATAIVAVAGYFGYKYFVFRGRLATSP